MMEAIKGDVVVSFFSFVCLIQVAESWKKMNVWSIGSFALKFSMKFREPCGHLVQSAKCSELTKAASPDRVRLAKLSGVDVSDKNEWADNNGSITNLNLLSCPFSQCKSVPFGHERSKILLGSCERECLSKNYASKIADSVYTHYCRVVTPWSQLTHMVAGFGLTTNAAIYFHSSMKRNTSPVKIHAMMSMRLNQV